MKKPFNENGAKLAQPGNLIIATMIHYSLRHEQCPLRNAHGEASHSICHINSPVNSLLRMLLPSSKIKASASAVTTPPAPPHPSGSHLQRQFDPPFSLFLFAVFKIFKKIFFLFPADFLLCSLLLQLQEKTVFSRQGCASEHFTAWPYITQLHFGDRDSPSLTDCSVAGPYLFVCAARNTRNTFVVLY